MALRLELWISFGTQVKVSPPDEDLLLSRRLKHQVKFREPVDFESLSSAGWSDCPKGAQLRLLAGFES